MGKTTKNTGMPPTINSHPKHLFKYHTKMNELRVFYEAGVLLALYDALTLARDSGSPAPEWIIGAAALVVGIQLHQGASIGSGPSGNTESQYRLDMIHFRRWSVVKALQASNPAGSVYEKAE